MSAGSARGRTWMNIREKVFNLHGTSCYLQYEGICKGTAEQVDHVIPKAKGGTDDMDNLRPACFPCNRRKSDKVLNDEWCDQRWITYL